MKVTPATIETPSRIMRPMTPYIRVNGMSRHSAVITAKVKNMFSPLLGKTLKGKGKC